MHRRIARNLRVERNTNQVARTHTHNLPLMTSRHLHTLTSASHNRRTNKRRINNHLITGRGQPRQAHLRRINLRTKSVTTHRNIQNTQRLLTRCRIINTLRQHNQASTRTQSRQARRNRLNQRLTHTKNTGQTVNRRRLTTRQNQRIQTLKLLTGTHPTHLSAQRLQHLRMLTHAALQRQNTNRQTLTRQNTGRLNLLNHHRSLHKTTNTTNTRRVGPASANPTPSSNTHPECGVRARITSRAPPGGAVPECQQR